MKTDALKVFVETSSTVPKREIDTRMEVDHTTILRHLSEKGKVKKMNTSQNNCEIKRIKICNFAAPTGSFTNGYLFISIIRILFTSSMKTKDDLIDSEDQNVFKTDIYALKSPNRPRFN